MAKFKVTINRERCKGCGLCIHYCKFDVLEADKDVNSHGYFSAQVKNGDNCTGCTSCYLVCPDMAVRIDKEDK